MTNSSTFQKAAPKPDFWTNLENNMLATVVTVLEVSLFLFAATRALFSIVKPNVQSGIHYLFIVLPLAIILPALHAEAKKTETHDD